MALVLIQLAQLGCSSDSPDPDSCEGRAEAFETFVAEHQGCTESSECTVIGDCSGSADWQAIRRDAAAEGRRLMATDCRSAYDGEAPSYAVCRERRCVAVYTGRSCFRRAFDSGSEPDGSSDAGAASDGSLDAPGASDASSDARDGASAATDASDAGIADAPADIGYDAAGTGGADAG
jgi:hypothetical protein